MLKPFFETGMRDIVMRMRKITRIAVLIPGILIGFTALVYLWNHMTDRTVFIVFIPGITVCLMSIGIYFSFGYCDGNVNGNVKPGLKTAWAQDDSENSETES
jgi:hypothetical protein